MKKTLIACMCFIVILVSGCNGNSPNAYHAEEVGVSGKVLHGTIIGQREVVINNHGDIGRLAGTTGGAVAGSAIGGGKRSNILGAIGGAVVGNLVGRAIDKNVNRQKGIEYIIRLKKDGSSTSITQANDLKLSIGQKVLIIYGNTTRVIPDQTIAVDAHNI